MCWGGRWAQPGTCGLDVQSASQSLIVNRLQVDHIVFPQEVLMSRQAWPPLAGSRSACGHKKKNIHLLDCEGSISMDLTVFMSCTSQSKRILYTKPNSVQEPLYPQGVLRGLSFVHLYSHTSRARGPSLDNPLSPSWTLAPVWPSSLPLCPHPLLFCGSLITGSALRLITSKTRLPLHPNPIIPALCVTTPPKMIYQRIIHRRFKKDPFAFIWKRFKHKWPCNSFWFLQLIWT